MHKYRSNIKNSSTAMAMADMLIHPEIESQSPYGGGTAPDSISPYQDTNQSPIIKSNLDDKTQYLRPSVRGRRRVGATSMKIKEFKIMQTLDCYMDETAKHAQSLIDKNDRLQTTKDKLRIYMFKN